jgi:hypothetical protein
MGELKSSPFYFTRIQNMKITLNSNHSFWGLMDPVDLKLTLSLNDSTPDAELDETKLSQWEIKQITGSVKDKKISISLHLEDLLKLSTENTKQEKKVANKKAAKIKA